MWSMKDPHERDDFLDRLSIKHQTSQLFLCRRPGAQAIWFGRFLVINHARLSRILKYSLLPKRATEADDTVFTVWAALFAKFYLRLVWQRYCFWKRSVMKGVLIWRHTAKQCETHKVVATKLNFDKHTLQGNAGNWKMITMNTRMTCRFSGDPVMMKAVPAQTGLIGVQRYLMHDRWRRRESQWCMALLARDHKR